MSKKYKYHNRRYQPPFQERTTCDLCGTGGLFWVQDQFTQEWNLMSKDGPHDCIGRQEDEDDHND